MSCHIVERAVSVCFHSRLVEACAVKRKEVNNIAVKSQLIEASAILRKLSLRYQLIICFVSMLRPQSILIMNRQQRVK